MAEKNDKARIELNDRPQQGASAGQWRLELAALVGFCGSGLFFVVSGLRSGDILTVIGSLVWIGSCLLWMYTYRKSCRK